MVIHIGSDLIRCLKIQASITTKLMPGWNTSEHPLKIFIRSSLILGANKYNAVRGAGECLISNKHGTQKKSSAIKEHFDTQLTQFDQDPAHLRTWWEETMPKVKKKKAFSTVWWFTHAGIFGRREIKEFSTMPRNRLCRLLQESRKTLHKGKGL